MGHLSPNQLKAKKKRKKSWSLWKKLLDPRMTMPRSHIHGSPRPFYYGLNLTDDPGNANIRSPIRMHYISMIKYYHVWLRMQYGKLRTNTDCHEWCLIVSVANPASSPWMCDLGIIVISTVCLSIRSDNSHRGSRLMLCPKSSTVTKFMIVARKFCWVVFHKFRNIS